MTKQITNFRRVVFGLFLFCISLLSMDVLASNASVLNRTSNYLVNDDKDDKDDDKNNSGNNGNSGNNEEDDDDEYANHQADIDAAGPTSFCAGGSVQLNGSFGKNNGFGNGDQDAPGNSGSNNNAENSDHSDPSNSGNNNSGGGNFSYQWQLNGVNISGATTLTYTASASGTYTLVVSNPGHSFTSSIVVTVNSLPVVVITSRTFVLCKGDQTGTAQASASLGTSPYAYSWNTSPIQTTSQAINLGVGTYSVQVTDAAGCKGSASATIIQKDSIKPSISCKSYTAALNKCGKVIVFASDVTASMSDACGIKSAKINPSKFTCANIGPNTVTLTVKDSAGNTSTCSAIVTVVDNRAPEAICKKATVFLDSTGQASITAADIDKGSKDNCGIASMSVSPNTFDCSNVGPNTVVLTVTDNYGNVSTCSNTVTVKDKIAPVIGCKNATVKLNSAGIAKVLIANVLDFADDACGIKSMSISPKNFTCANVGDNAVTLKVKDNNGNISTCIATVTVVDDKAPVLDNSASGLTVECDGSNNSHANNGFGNGDQDAPGNSGDHNNAENSNHADPSNSGNNNGNHGINAPSGNFGDLQSWLANNGGAVATDNCGVVWSNDFNGLSVSCGSTGSAVVTFTATDPSGNSVSTTAEFKIEDTTPPTISGLSDIFICYEQDNYGCDVDLGTPTADDQCSDVTITSDAPDCFLVGSTLVTWTATDACGNTAQTTQTVVRNPQMEASICAAPTTTIYSGTFQRDNGPVVGPLGPQSVQLNASVSGGTPGYSYSWSPAVGLSCFDCADPVASPTTTTTYTVVATDSKGCSISNQLTISVIPLSEIYCGKASASQGSYKFSVCHVPPGNSNNPQNICISVNALSAHLVGSKAGGHDNCYLGPCHNNCSSAAYSRVAAKSIDNESISMQNDFVSLNLYPNPFSENTKFSFVFTNDTHVSIEVFDMSGKSIAKIFDRDIVKSEEYNAEFQANNLRSGLYIYKVQTSTNTYVGKMSLIRQGN